MTRGGKQNAQRLGKRALEKRGAIPMNRAERRAFAASALKRKPAARVAKATGAQIKDARKELAKGLLQREEALAETRAQIVDPRTGQTVEEERRSRLWTPRLWLPGRGRKK